MYADTNRPRLKSRQASSGIQKWKQLALIPPVVRLLCLWTCIFASLQTGFRVSTSLFHQVFLMKGDSDTLWPSKDTVTFKSSQKLRLLMYSKHNDLWCWPVGSVDTWQQSDLHSTAESCIFTPCFALSNLPHWHLALCLVAMCYSMCLRVWWATGELK